MATLSPWSLKVYQDDTKSVLIATVTRLPGVQISKKTNTTGSISLTAVLADYKAANITRGMYFELSRARSGAKASWETGYIQNITRDTSGSALTLTGVDASWYLDEFRTLRDFNAGPGLGYLNVIDLFNGNPAGSTSPEHQGILPPNWTAHWVDDINTPASTAAGFGEVWKGGGDTAMSSVAWAAQHYGFLWRLTPGHTNNAYSASMDIGPLGDSSGLAIWGGAPLLVDMQTNHGYVSTTGRADLGTAQQLGYAVITNAQHQSDYSNIRNVVWVIGKAGLSIHHLAGGPPLDSGGSPQNGWSLFSPTHAGHGRPYYVKTNSNYATFDGNFYTFVAAQTQSSDAKDGTWEYGVIDTTSYNEYGPCEYTLEELKISDSRMLLAAALGCLNTWSQPVESFTFTVAQPLTSASGNPARAVPGQTVAVHYSGQMPSIERDANGQWGPSGSGTYTYIDYPWTTDAHAVARLKQVIQYDEQWSNGQLVQTLTLGTSKNKKNVGVNNALARQLLHNRHDHPRVHTFKKYEIDSIPFLCSTSPVAYDREKTRTLVMNPGSIAVSDTPHTMFFTDGHSVIFTTAVTDGTEYLDFWINKPVDNGTLLSPNPTPGGGATRSYLAFRLAFTASANSATNSATTTGFFSTSNGTAWTQRGTTHRSLALDASFRLPVGTYRIKIGWAGGKFQAWLQYADISMPAGSQRWEHIATFDDISPAIANNNWGAIGLMLHQGAAVATIWDLHAVAYHPSPPEKGSVGRAAEHPTKAEAKSKQTTGGVTVYGNPALLKPS